MMRVFAIACSLVLLGLPAGVRAAESVLLLVPNRPDPLLGEVFHRLEAELQLQGFDTITIVSERADAGTLQAQVEKARALAAIAVTPRDRSAALEICVVDRNTKQVSMRTLDAGARDDAPSVLAVRAADLLRAWQAPNAVRRPEKPTPPKPPRPAAAASEPEEEEDEPEFEGPPPPRGPRPRFWLSAEANMLHPGANFGLAFGPQLGLWYWPNDWLAIGLLGAGPLTGTTLSKSNGSATLRQELVWVEAQAVVLRLGPVAFAPIAGAGIYLMQAEGRVSDPLRGRSTGLWNWLAHVGVRVDVELLERLTLGAALRVRALIPGVVVAIDTQTERMTLPVLDAALGIAVGF